ncbi:YdcF family protein [Microbacteriaceae bacterium VKM Ac-2855]|nr:YdcF family protein [Microbacteriaceae bacterium VKM Ac-2855]
MTRRRLRTIAVAMLAALVLGVVAGLPAYVFPHTDPVPESADAIVVLGPATRARTDLARDLAARGVSDTLLISVWASDQALDPDERDVVACNEPALRVFCFTAEPATTQGEARALAEYAEKYDWNRVVVITQTPHITRARMLLERCYGGRILMETSGEPFAALDYVYEYGYQTAGFVKAALNPGC